MKKKIIVTISAITFFPALYLLGICFREVTTITEVKRVTGTPCIKSENGNCYCWDYTWSEPDIDTTEKCEKEGEKCTSWNTSERIIRDGCTEHANCGCRSGPELNASCIDPSLCIRKEKVTEKRKECTSNW